MKKIKYFVLLLLALLWISCSSEKTAYIDNYQVFEGFAGKKELEQRHKKEGLQKQQVLDSMKVQLIAMKQQVDPNIEQLKAYEQRYVALSRQFNQEVEARNNEYTAEVWKQINQYVIDFGKEQDYDYIFGSATNGSLMYAKDSKEITKEVIEYINKKYAGQ